jgi:GSCFA family
MSHPYQSLPDRAFWKNAVSGRGIFEIANLWTPKFAIRQSDKIATYGSCFAVHIGPALRAHGYNWHVTEAPPFGLSSESACSLGYNLFSSRTGNIYTASLLAQWARWACGLSAPPEAEAVCENDRYYDPFRPRIEPGGFESLAELRCSREQAVKSFRASIFESQYFIFTLGLTESWHNLKGGYEYPVCPGTACGAFDASAHAFKKMSFQEISEDLQSAISMMRHANPSLKFIFTVSPVSLVATYSGNHVLAATVESKSVLRAVVAELMSRPFVDYFPSYELISSPVSRGVFYEANQRSVQPAGVDFVMKHFFAALHPDDMPARASKPETRPPAQRRSTESRCEEELLEAFGSR